MDLPFDMQRFADMEHHISPVDQTDWLEVPAAPFEQPKGSGIIVYGWRCPNKNCGMRNVPHAGDRVYDPKTKEGGHVYHHPGCGLAIRLILDEQGKKELAALEQEIKDRGITRPLMTTEGPRVLVGQ